MANVKLKFNLSKLVESDIGDSNDNLSRNNISSNSISDLSKDYGEECIVIGDKFKEKELKIVDSYNGFIGGLTNSMGKLSEDLTITVFGVNNGLIDNVTFYFDSVAKQYPMDCVYDDKTIFNDDNTLTIKWEEPSKSKTFTFRTWKRNNYPACITYIGVEIDNIELNNSSLKSIESINQSQPIQDEPFYSIIESTGSFKFSDTTGEFLDYANDGVLSQGSKIKILINEKEYFSSNVKEWNEPNKSLNEFGGELEDISKKLEYNFEGYKYEYVETNAKLFLEEILNHSNIEYDISNVENVLENIKLDFKYLESSTYKEIIEKFCNLAQIQCCSNKENNKIIFYNARPRYNNEKIISIPTKAQFNDFESKTIPSNNFKGIEIDESFLDYKNDIHSVVKTLKFNSVDLELLDKKNSVTNGFYSDSVNFYVERKNFPFQALDYKIKQKYVVGKKVYTEGVLSSIGYLTYKKIPMITIPKKMNKNLDYIKKIYKSRNENEEGIKISINCTKKTTKYSEFQIDYTSDLSNNYSLKSVYFNNKIEEKIEYVNLNSSINVSKNKFSTLSSIAGLEDHSVFYGENLFTEDNDNYYIKGLVVFNSSDIFKGQGDSFVDTYYTPRSVSGEGIEEEYDSNYIDISVYGDRLRITLEKETKKIGTEKYYKFNSNELIQKETMYLTEPIIDVISRNIILDYSSKNGIRTATLSVCCGVDFYDSDGNLAIDWSGESENLPNTFEIGQVVKVLDYNGESKSKYSSNEDRLWRITGIGFTYEILPKWKLELVEVW